jgi:hypothetical protein
MMMKLRESGRRSVFWKVGVGVEGWEWNRVYEVGVVLLLGIRLDLGLLGDLVVLYISLYRLSVVPCRYMLDYVEGVTVQGAFNTVGEQHVH